MTNEDKLYRVLISAAWRQVVSVTDQGVFFSEKDGEMNRFFFLFV